MTTAEYIKLTPWDFDQTDAGWRALDSAGEYEAAAAVIEAYIEHNGALIAGQTKVSLATLHFHAGQEWAMAGPERYLAAAAHFKLAYKQQSTWDAYVDGTLAFVTANLPLVTESAAKLDEVAARSAPHQFNADVLHRFARSLQGSGQTYAQAFDEASDSR